MHQTNTALSTNIRPCLLGEEAVNGEGQAVARVFLVHRSSLVSYHRTDTNVRVLEVGSQMVSVSVSMLVLVLVLESVTRGEKVAVVVVVVNTSS